MSSSFEHWIWKLFFINQLLNAIGKKPTRQEFKSIQMMLQTRTRKIDVYEVEVRDVEGKFKMSHELNWIERDVMMTLPESRHQNLQGLGRMGYQLPKRPLWDGLSCHQEER